MKKFLIGLIFILIGLSVKSQQIQSFHYWFDAESVNSVRSAAYSGSGDLDIPTDPLGLGSHSMFYYFTSSDGGRSGVNVSSFFKTTVLAGSTGAEYWFDDDRGNKKNILISNLSEFENTQNINTDDLSLGEHVLSIRFLNSGGLWSSITKTTFTKTSVSGGVSGMEYWFDDDFVNKKSVPLGLNSFSDRDIDVSDIKQGYHTAYIRFKQGGGLWSGITTVPFLKRNNSGISTNNPVIIKYWFDDDLRMYANKYLANSFVDFDLKTEASHLNDGRHKLSYQIRDNYGVWSSVSSDSFTKTNVSVKEFYDPSLAILNTSQIYSNGFLSVKGSMYKPNQEVKLILKRAYENSITIVEPLISNENGDISLIKTLNSSEFKKGVYSIQAIDEEEKYSSKIIYFTIDNLAPESWPNNITVLSPLFGNTYLPNDEIKIVWKDNFVLRNSLELNQINGSIKRAYQISFSKDNGSWIPIQGADALIKEAFFGSEKSMSFSTRFSKAGAYRIKITDKLSNSFFETPIFSVGSLQNLGFDVERMWDYSTPPLTTSAPKGCAADGTARIYLKIKRKQNVSKVITSVKVTLSDEFNNTSKELLGKVMPALTLNGYDTEANSAVLTESATNNILNNGSEVWFWYVAPDNFLDESFDNGKRYLNVRKVKIKVEVSYDNGSSEVDDNVFVEIVRPPLMLVHGLNGDEHTWDNFVYSRNQQIEKFNNSNIWQFKQISNMKPDGSFAANAAQLLDLKQNNFLPNESYPSNPQSFQNLISRMRRSSYAVNRVDYVAHSMGGNMIRYAIDNFSDYYYVTNSASGRSVKNYGKGFVNKLITINTPHDGSPFANFLVDLPSTSYGVLRQLLYNYNIFDADGLSSFYNYTPAPPGDLLGETFGTPIYNPTDAVLNLRKEGGIKFNATNVKNHLIAGVVKKQSDINLEESLKNFVDLNDNNKYWLYLRFVAKLYDSYKKIVDVKAAELTFNQLLESNPNGFWNLYNNYGSLVDFTSTSGTGVVKYILKATPWALKSVGEKYAVNCFDDYSDGIVSLSSQLAGKELPSATNNTVTVFDGVNFNHLLVTDQPQVGDRVLDLLNASILGSKFSDIIPASSGNQSKNCYSSSGTWVTDHLPKIRENTSSQDSIIRYYSASKARVLNKDDLRNVNPDSVLLLKYKIFDTTGLKLLTIDIAGEIYSSICKIDTQNIYFQIKHNLAKIDLVQVTGYYDSLGFSLAYIDTFHIKIANNTQYEGFFVFPKSKKVDSSQVVSLFYNLVYPNKISGLNPVKDSIGVYISDTTLLKLDSLKRLIGLKSGLAYVVFNYKGLLDTVFVSVSSTMLQDDSDMAVTCAVSEIKLGSGNSNALNYLWKVDKGFGFEQILDLDRHFGVESDSLTIVNPPSEWFAYKYKCFIETSSGNTLSNIYSIRFSRTWLGLKSALWEDPSNWECGMLPDEFSDVFIPAGKLNYPIVSSDLKVNSLVLESGSTVTVLAGKRLDIKSKN